MTREEAINALDIVEHMESFSVSYGPGEPMNQTTVGELKEACRMAISTLRTQVDTPPNGPLTPEELREMGEGWVWIELLVPFYRMESGYYRKRSRFSDADKFCCGYFNVVIRDLPYSLYGDTWLAFRRRPEEVTQ